MNGSGEKRTVGGVPSAQHGFQVSARKEMSISGVKEVESFDEESVSLHTSGGDMTVEGKGLRIGVLDTDRGVVTLSGRIDGVFYSTEDGEEKRGFWSRLFR
ncbi:MAG: sporulation protein YabP [Ruminococcaceae bacterium]|nr:sporulation protein YabP [Oscillospiraceae bacterium]